MAPDEIPTPLVRDDVEVFRLELLAQLPYRGVTNDDDPLGGQAYVDDADYDAGALAAWAASRVREIRQDVMLAAIDDVNAMEADQAATVEFAGAVSTFTAMAEWLRYLKQLAPVLKTNLGLADQWDLARTLEAEADRVAGVLGQLAARFPQISSVLGDKVGALAQELVLPADRG